MSHRSEKLDKYIGKSVEVTFKDHSKEKGFLYHNYRGIQGYRLENEKYSVRFCKTSVKAIEVNR